LHKINNTIMTHNLTISQAQKKTVRVDNLRTRRKMIKMIEMAHLEVVVEVTTTTIMEEVDF